MSMYTDARLTTVLLLDKPQKVHFLYPPPHGPPVTHLEEDPGHSLRSGGRPRAPAQWLYPVFLTPHTMPLFSGGKKADLMHDFH